MDYEIREHKKRVGIYRAPLFSNINGRGSKTVAPIKVIKQIRPVKSGDGFTLMELLVCIAIFAILLTGVLGSFAATTRAVKSSREKTILSSLSTNYLEIIRNMPYGQVGTINGSPNGGLPDFTNAYSQNINGIIYKIYYEVTYIDDPADGTALAGTDPYPADYKQVKMDILNTSTNQINSFFTSVVPKGLEGTVNQGALQIQVIDSQGNPIPGVNVHITYPTTTPSIILDRLTDSTGQWVEVGLPPAAHNYRVVVSKTGYSQDQTYAVTAQNPNPLHPDATVAVGQVTKITFSIDLISNLTIKTLNAVCQPLNGVNLNILGAKLIGSSPNVYKYNNNYSSGPASFSAGLISLPSTEWDTYTPTLLTGQSVITYGTSPIQQITVLPNTSQTFTMILGVNSTSQSLLVVVKDASSSTALENASVTLTDGGSFSQTLLTGGSVWMQKDWSGGSGQANWSTSTPGQYFQDNGSVDVSTSGQIKLTKIAGNYTSATGTLESSAFDTGTNATNYTILSWQPPSQSASTTVAFQVAANNDNATWNYVGPDGTSATYFTTPGQDMGSPLDNNEFFRYKVFLSSSDPTKTPTLTSVNANFVTGCFTPGQVIFTGLANKTYYVTVSMPGYTTQSNVAVTVTGNQFFPVLMSP
jgi:prepilin-type N-terminal cleavage/methylation domain-containing protein